MRNITIPVRQLVEFVYRSGDLDSTYRSNTRALKGIKAHKILQSNMGENYLSEVFLKHEFEYKDIIFIVEGRADGIIENEDEIIIDEIKSTYKDIEQIDENYNQTHWAQAKCYGYIYCVKNDIDNINIQLRYYNLNTSKEKTITQVHTKDELGKFFNELIERYFNWAERFISWEEIRDNSIENMQFPFKDYRKGQREFAVSVYKTILKNKKLFAQAPTGVGKTVSTLFPSIKAISKTSNSKIYYLTAKSLTKQVAFDTIEMMSKQGLRLKTIVITAKEKICFKEECICEPEHCEYADGYFDRVNDALLEALEQDLYDREFIEKISKKYKVCPFEFCLELSLMSDVTICDYNYYFDPRVALKREFTNNNIILIDEAHNLVDRTRSMYSTELWKEDFLKASKPLKENEKKLYKILKTINTEMLSLRKTLNEKERHKVLEEKPEELLKKLRKFISFGDEWLESNKNHKEFKEILDLYFQTVSFIRISEIIDENFCYYIEKLNNKFRIKLYCINPADILAETTKDTGSVIFFSATLTPLKYFRYILGGDDSDHLLKLTSPFNEDNLNISIINNISLKYSVRDANINQVCNYINTIVNRKEGNYMIFFPSYKYMHKVYEEYIDLYNAENIVIQEQNMSESEHIDFINKFEDNKNITAFTVIGGAFSEGIDLTYDKLIGVAIIGTGIPQICLERNLIKELFDKKHNMGFQFAYMYPGFNKVLQASGRVIRTELDVGTLVLIDSRFNQSRYCKLFPEHWHKFNVINSSKQLINVQNNFWKKSEE